MLAKIKTRKELIKKYIEFFKSKEHKEIPSASLVPQNDPTVLFTVAGMQPLVPFLLGEKHPLGKRLCDVQKCIRTNDIDGVGDEVHHTFFEMLGNWSLGDYFKEEAIKMTFEFQTKVLGVPLERYAVTCFAGDKNAGRDDESVKVWESLGIKKDRIAFLAEDNWWGPAGTTGPCGPSTEQFFYTGDKAPRKFDPSDRNWVEIGNDVLMQYVKDERGDYNLAKQKNIDFGGGVERTLAVLNGLSDNYLSSIFEPMIKEIEAVSKKKYGKDKNEMKAMRIIADHIRAATFIIGDGVVPGNVERGYVLRRLIRRAIRYGRLLGITENFTAKIALKVIESYDDYLELAKNKNNILTKLDEEENKFNNTLDAGMREFAKLAKADISGKDAFLLYQSYGFPIEMTQELAKENGINVDVLGFNDENKKHQELSRTASAGQFKSGLADNSEQTKKLHTATHLLNEALRRVLGDDIKQKGSNINPERLRFDFNLGRKMTDDEIKKVAEIVNEKIKDKLEVKKEEMKLDDALKSGAQAEFGAKYPEKVSVYTVIDKKDKKGFFSKEICTGPHVSNTKEIGKFKIIKEESVAAGVRRIKAVVE
jgi:alanyl-tRNA synthetase